MLVHDDVPLLTVPDLKMVLNVSELVVIRRQMFWN